MSANRLTGLDSSFLHLERGPAHMHVASTTLFEGPPPNYDDFREHIDSRLHLVPRFRQKLRFVPFGQGRPRWVDDPQFNLNYHLRHTALPSPGSDEQLRTFAARVFSQRLDRSKPLWEMWLVDGLADDRFAIVAKTHHCLVDGVSGVDITTVLFDAAPEPEPVPVGEPWVAEPEPSDAQVLGEALVERATSPAEIVRGARAVFRAPRRAARAAVDGLEAAGAFARSGLGAPSSPFNVEIGPYRRFEMVQTSLADLKRIKNELGGTVNDVVLAAVAGALGRYLRGHGYSTQELELRAMVPISVRGADEHGALGNRVSSYMAPLPIWCDDPVERLRRVSATMGDLKQSKQAVGATLMTELTDFAPPTIAGQAARLQSRQRFFNLVVTNIPGPQFPLYLMGRRLEAVFPMVPLAQPPGGLLRDHELRRPGQLRADRRLRRARRTSSRSPRTSRPRLPSSPSSRPGPSPRAGVASPPGSASSAPRPRAPRAPAGWLHVRGRGKMPRRSTRGHGVWHAGDSMCVAWGRAERKEQHLSKARMLRPLLAVGALVALGAAAAGGPATASPSSKGGATVIKMEQEGKELFFDGPATVEAGTQLKIKNNTNPRKIGPHTFSLVREKTLPEGKEQIKKCAREFKGMCGEVVKWHEVDLQTGQVGENPVEVGKQGWDRKGDRKRKGDSWVSERKNQSFKRKVTAPEGKTLTFFCAVHPEMQGEIKVTE